MRSVQFSEYGGPEVLHVADTDEPHAGSGTVRIAVRAAGVNAMDWKIRSGYPSEQMPLTFPAGVGMDAWVSSTRSARVWTGSRSATGCWGGHGALAEHAVLSAWAAMPDGLSFEEAAGYPSLSRPRFGSWTRSASPLARRCW